MNKPRVTLRQRVLHLRAIIACRMLGLGKLKYWVRSKEGIYTYLKGERGEMIWLLPPVYHPSYGGHDKSENYDAAIAASYLSQSDEAARSSQALKKLVYDMYISKGWEEL